MLRVGWNFHGDIAVPVEMRLRQAFPHEAYVHYADAIETGELIASYEKLIMHSLALSEQPAKYDTEVKNFFFKYEIYRGQGSLDIPNEVAQQSFDDFVALVEAMEG